MIYNRTYVSVVFVSMAVIFCFTIFVVYASVTWAYIYANANWFGRDIGIIIYNYINLRRSRD